MANKVTKVERISNNINTYAISGEDKDFLLHEIELLNKRNAYKSDKPTKKQTENEATKQAIYEAMEVDKPYTATDIATALGLSSPQKASALLKQMVAAGVVVKTEDKRRAYFTLVNPTEVE